MTCRDCIEQDSRVARRSCLRPRPVYIFASTFQTWQEDAGERQVCLQRQMTQKVPLDHRCDRVDAHDRMAIDSISLVVGTGSGKQVAKRAVALQCWSPGNDRNWIPSDSGAG